MVQRRPTSSLSASLTAGEELLVDLLVMALLSLTGAAFCVPVAWSSGLDSSGAADCSATASSADSSVEPLVLGCVWRALSADALKCVMRIV